MPQTAYMEADQEVSVQEGLAALAEAVAETEAQQFSVFFSRGFP